tara:strand:- start:126 stop:995 length:870 start_codon:yes stop_codon:yes gene_type:complete
MDRIYKKSTKEFYTLVFLALVSAGTIIVDHKYKQADYARSMINDLIVYPIYNISSMPRNFFTSFMKEYQDIETLESEIEKLKRENMSLKINLQEFEALREENIRLRDIQKKTKESSNKQTIAKVLNNSASPNKKIIIIDKGQNDGLYKGQNVIGIKGLIGQIIESNSMSSKVILINDKNHNVPGVVNRTGEKVIIAGENKDNELLIQFTPLDTTVEEGDIVTTSGVAGRFKSKIPIGKVTSVVKDPEKKFSEIKIKTFENLSNISDVILIWDYKPISEEDTTKEETNNE